MAEQVIAREKPYILHFFTTQKHFSPFDANMASDAGYDSVFTYTDVALEDVTGLVQDAIFSRGPRGVWRTGIFIGGRDLDVAMEMLEKAKKAMFPPFQVSLFADPAGAFTTGAALSAHVVSTCLEHFNSSMKDKRVVVFGATGPVGGCASIMCAKEGADVRLVAHSNVEKTTKLAEKYSAAYGVSLKCVDGTDDAKKAAVIADAEILLCCAAAGVRVITTEMLQNAKGLLVAADVNAVPPSGIEGLDAMSNAQPIKGAEWALGLGALAIGNRKYNLQKKMFQMMLESDTNVTLDFLSAYEVARKL
ncbi:methylene-tetrahydromethanopterin dehydrogenase [Novimethylophilus kurashikiensis]|jgi:methylene-tetrahydromethanopterin dehydrogenase|uniref:Methylene-tetrahydromethanopterin dehydrogenase n=1 Tax=Novimethylophilus kurashikiensis TaxID=1825523 RepID=A0A2R5FAZ5_9PROT|nr:NAD(P)-dependent methylenetetrahydromethanopterin dehydrogenase [Novimethylophilus kurashikiensis]GBG15410.1 methylene-tetrahydromethanopterin dehydrogenase [Novimethylophilus kurashikiensis]